MGRAIPLSFSIDAEPQSNAPAVQRWLLAVAGLVFLMITVGGATGLSPHAWG